MATTRNVTRRPDLREYYQTRVEQLSQRLLDQAEELTSKQAEVKRTAFADYVERRLQSGAKFVFGKGQPR